ncbi:phage tail protein, partial [Salmonella enterica subsp. enterica serovar Kinondoni]|nr:phage tail protein [Salmonella enterica subsp. enterica serovar Kinondoni]
KYVVNRGRNANGNFEIWNDGTVEMFGFGGAPVSGLANVTYPIQLPGGVIPVIHLSDMISGDPGNTQNLHQSVLITSSRTSSGFSIRQRSTDGVIPANGFAWRAKYAPV